MIRSKTAVYKPNTFEAQDFIVSIIIIMNLEYANIVFQITTDVNNYNSFLI